MKTNPRPLLGLDGGGPDGGPNDGYHPNGGSLNNYLGGRNDEPYEWLPVWQQHELELGSRQQYPTCEFTPTFQQQSNGLDGGRFATLGSPYHRQRFV
jgi:hypothetical protein